MIIMSQHFKTLEPLLLVKKENKTTKANDSNKMMGGELLEIAELPEDSEQRRLTGESHRCIYKFRL